jgi:hypothetical protein
MSKLFNSSHGALGSGTRANAAVGRALKLVLLNVGGGILAGSESTTLGSPMKFTMCVAENEAKCKAERWEPYHVEKGFAADDTVVTVIPVTSGPVQIVDFFARDSDTLIALIVQSLVSVYNRDMPLINDCTIVVSPEHLETLVRGGITSKREFKRRLWRECNACMSSSYSTIINNKIIADNKLPPAVAPIIGLLAGTTLNVVAKTIGLVGAEPLSVIPKFTSEDSFHVVVAGGPAGKFTSFMPGFGIGVPPMSTAHLSNPVSRAVVPGVEGVDYASIYDPSEIESVIVNPKSSAEIAAFKPAKRSGKMGKVIGFMDISKPKSDQVLERIAELIKQKYGEGHEIRHYRKQTFSRRASSELIEQMSKECNHVIGALAD